jgi:hypothetical protein
MARTTIGKGTRFEVFKRDKFTCQYCGRSAPDVVLHVDHIQPVAKDGDNDILNLITACRDCNAGKSDKTLSDDSAIQKRKQQLDDLQERREQLDMMMEWHKLLIDLDSTATDSICELWSELVSPFSLTEIGKASIGKLVRTYGLAEIFESLRISVNQYVELGQDGKPTAESVNKAFEYIGRIARNRKRIQERPYLNDLYHIRSIAKGHCNYFNDWKAIDILERAHLAGCDMDEMRDIARSTRNWSDWSWAMEQLLTRGAE